MNMTMTHLRNHDSSRISFKTLDSTFSPQRQPVSWSASSEVLGDITFGLRSERGSLMVGNMRVYDEEEIFISVVTHSKKHLE